MTFGGLTSFTMTAHTDVARAQPLTVPRLVDVSRALLIEGGPDAIVIREVARRLSVTAPALYKHVGGRDDLLTLLIAACTDEATAACAAALEAYDPGDAVGRLQAATWAFRSWAQQNPAEFDLVYGTPIVGYTAPSDGPTTTASQQFGQLFGGIFVQLLEAGRLRTVPDSDLSQALATDLKSYADGTDLPLSPGQVYPFVVGWHRMLGLISVEAAGHLRWVFADSEAFVRDQLDQLLDDLVL